MLARLFVIFGGLLVLALSVALVGPYFVDWTSYRADFEREASAILGREVKVNGSASARLLPFPSVTFTNVVVGADAGKPAMTVEEFSMDAELAPFMSGEVLIFDMRLVRPKAVIDVSADGTVDWAVRPSSPFDASAVSLEKVTVTEGQVAIRHAASGREHRLTEINTTLSARALTGPWRAQGTLRIDGMRTAMTVSTGTVDETGAMRLKIAADPALYPIVVDAEGDVRNDEGRLVYAGQFRVGDDTQAAMLRSSDGETVKAKEPGQEPAHLGFRLSGNFRLDHERLGIDEFAFATGPLDNPYTADGTAFIDLGTEPRFGIETKGAQVRFDEAIGGTQAALTLEQRLAALETALQDLPRPTIPGTVRVDLPAIVAGDTTIRDVKLSAQPASGGWTIQSVSASLPGRTTLEASGVLTGEPEFGFEGSLLLAVAQPSGFAAWLSRDVDDAIRRLPAAGFNAKVELSPRRQVFDDLELVLGNARFQGSIDSSQPEDARPAVLLKLDGGAMDVDGLAAFASLFFDDHGANRHAGRDLDLAVRAGPVSIGGLTAESVDTALRLREGQLEIDRLAVAGLAGASVSATGTIRDFPANPVGNLDVSVVAVDLAPLIALAAERFPQNAALAALQNRSAGYAGLFSDARIDVVASGAANGDGTTGLAISGQGVAGGSTVSLSLTANGRPEALRDASVTASLNAHNADATALLALAGFPVAPLGLLGSGDIEISAKGSIGGGLETKARLNGLDFSAGFEGTTTLLEQGPTAKGRLTLEADDLAPWLVSTGMVLPGMAAGLPATLAADADYANRLLVLSGLEGAVDENAVSGDINAEVKDGVPHLTGALQLDLLSLDAVLAMVLGEEQVGTTEAEWPSLPFQQKSMAPFSAEIDIVAATLAAGALPPANDANLSLSLDSEGLRVSGLTATLLGGDVAGLFELKNNDGTGLLTAQATLNGADLAVAFPNDRLTGKGDFSASLSSSGKSVAGIVAELSGTGTAGLKGLSIGGVNPDALPALIARADLIGRDIDVARTAEFVPEIVGQGMFPAADTDIAFTVAGGILRAPPATFENEKASLSADLRADLNSGIVAASGTITYRPGDEALVGSEPALRFTLEGPPGETVRLFDSEPMAQFLTQRALEIEQARVEAMQAGLLEKQRLRREARYYAALQTERDRMAEQKQRDEEEARLAAEEKAKAEEEARLKAEAEAKAAAEKARQEADQPAPETAVPETQAPVPESAPSRPLAPQGEFPPAPRVESVNPFAGDGFLRALGASP